MYMYVLTFETWGETHVLGVYTSLLSLEAAMAAYAPGLVEAHGDQQRCWSYGAVRLLADATPYRVVAETVSPSEAQGMTLAERLQLWREAAGLEGAAVKD